MQTSSGDLGTMETRMHMKPAMCHLCLAIVGARPGPWFSVCGNRFEEERLSDPFLVCRTCPGEDP